MPVSAAAFDASKFFDHMERDTTSGILRELGMLARILMLMADHVFCLQCFFNQGQSCGPCWRASNGLVQGCSLTLVAAMASATVWAKFVRASIPEATLARVVDDRRMFVSGPQSVEPSERVVRQTREYDADTGTVTNLKKTSCATRRPRDKGAMKKVARDLGIRRASIETQVGYPTGQKCFRIPLARLSERTALPPARMVSSSVVAKKLPHAVASASLKGLLPGDPRLSSRFGYVSSRLVETSCLLVHKEVGVSRSLLPTSLFEHLSIGQACNPPTK